MFVSDARFCYVPDLSDNVQSAMFELLKRIQTDLCEVKVDVAGLKADVADIQLRAERLENVTRRIRRENVRYWS